MESMTAERGAEYRSHVLRARLRELEVAAEAATGAEAESLRVQIAAARGALIRERLAQKR